MLFRKISSQVLITIVLIISSSACFNAYANEDTMKLEKDIASSQGQKKVTLIIEYLKEETQFSPQKSEKYAKTALTIVSDSSPQKTTLLNYYALSKFHKNEFNEAREIFKQALKRARNSQNLENLMLVYLSYSRLENEVKNHQKSISLNEQGFLIAKKENNLAYLGEFQLFKALTLYNTNEYEKALQSTLLSYKYFEKLNDKISMVKALRWIGAVHRKAASFEKALEYQHKALKIVISTNDQKQISINYNNLGTLYKDLKDYDNAIKMHTKSLQIKESIDYLQGQIYSHNNLGETYRLAGQPEKSLIHLTSGMRIGKQVNNEKLMNFSAMYLGRLHRDIGNYDVSSNYLTNALAYFIETKRESRIAETCLALSRLFLLQGKLKQALEMAKKSLELANKQNRDIVIFGSYSALSSIYEEMKDFERALKNERAFLQQKEKIFSVRQERFFSTLKVEHEVEQQQREIKALIQKNEIDALQANQQIAQRNIVFISGALIFVLIGFIYYRYIQRKKLETERIVTLKIREKEQDLIELNANLETIVAKRTESLTVVNNSLEATLKELKDTQKSLIEVEKMAALSKLVAGVAHEVNTPVGTVITAVSFLKEELTNFKSQLIDNKVSKGILDGFLNSIAQSSELIENNATRSAELIHEFKQVAIQKRVDPPQNFLLSDTINKIMHSLLLNTIFQRVVYKLTIKGNCHINSYSTYWFQILEGLLINTVVHGFKDDTCSEIQVKLCIEEVDGQFLKIKYEDNGCGIKSDDIESIFEPFYTTLRSKGHAGLGLHIIYNMVTQTLKGSMSYNVQEGACFIITLPTTLQIE